MSQPLPTLSLVEARVLGTLVEKQRTTPDSYPLTLNSLTMGCNQKTSRAPVMELSETDVKVALDSLRGRNLVMETSTARATRYSHNFERVFQVPTQSSAILAVLMLRGPQTAGELRINCDRMHAFSDISAVEGFLNELAARSAGAMVVELPRLAHARENRWAHLLSGAPKVETPPPQATRPAEAPLTDLAATVARLEAELAEVKAEVARIRSKVG